MPAKATKQHKHNCHVEGIAEHDGRMFSVYNVHVGRNLKATRDTGWVNISTGGSQFVLIFHSVAGAAADGRPDS